MLEIMQMALKQLLTTLPFSVKMIHRITTLIKFIIWDLYKLPEEQLQRLHLVRRTENISALHELFIKFNDHFVMLIFPCGGTVGELNTCWLDLPQITGGPSSETPGDQFIFLKSFLTIINSGQLFYVSTQMLYQAFRGKLP